MITNIETIDGLAGLMECLHVSKSTAFRLVKSGVLDNATYRVGRLLRFDKAKVLEALQVTNQMPWAVK